MMSKFSALLRSNWRYATGLVVYLSRTTDRAAAERMLRRQLEGREDTFLYVLEHGIYGKPSSPYRRLLEHAGLSFEDVRGMVRNDGLLPALSRLYDAGVYVTLEEFKGRAPIERPGLKFDVTTADFNNPLLTVHYEGRSGGSRGGGMRVPISFDLLVHETANFLLSLHACGVAERPPVIWSEAPPGALGIKWALLFGRMKRRFTWFAPSQPSWNRQGIEGRARTIFTVLTSRLLRHSIPWPKVEPDVNKIAAFLADAVRRGNPALMLGTPSQWVRICLAAEEMGLDISGTVFWGGGEPFTEGKAAVLERTGTRAIISYAMAEAAAITHSCGAPSQPDDMHLLEDKLAVLTHSLGLETGLTVETLAYTSLLTSASKLMLNVESGDYATLEQRDCGCLWQQLGFTTHIHDVRSYEKLTSESVMFMGSMLHELLEQTLPSRFGGSPTDYQLVEEEEDGVTRVSVLVSPRVGPVDEAALIETVLQSVGSADWSRRMGDMWRRAGTLRVRRQEPYATGRGKILPLHVMGKTERQDVEVAQR